MISLRYLYLRRHANLHIVRHYTSIRASSIQIVGLEILNLLGNLLKTAPSLKIFRSKFKSFIFTHSDIQHHFVYCHMRYQLLYVLCCMFVQSLTLHKITLQLRVAPKTRTSFFGAQFLVS